MYLIILKGAQRNIWFFMHHAGEGENVGNFGGDLQKEEICKSTNDGTNRLLALIRRPWQRNAFCLPCMAIIEKVEVSAPELSSL